MEIEELLKELILVPGVSGYEDPIRTKIKTLIEDYVDEIEIDAIGNLIGIREGHGNGHLSFFAHMDELGLVVANITADGFIHFKKMGGIDDRILPSRHVRLFAQADEEVPGVIAWVPPHMAVEGQKNQDKVISWQEMVIDVGARSAEEVRAMGIRVGDPIVFVKQVSRLANGLIAARGLDNRAGCTALVALIQGMKELSPRPRISFVFTTQEEYGLRGASVAGYRTKPDSAFIIDTASAPDFPGVPAIYRNQFQIDRGPLLRLVDTRMVASRRLRNFVEELAVKKNIPFQLGVVGGSTDAAAVQLVRKGVPILPICIPCRYTHATVEVISLKDLEATVTLLGQIVEEYPMP